MSGRRRGVTVPQVDAARKRRVRRGRLQLASDWNVGGGRSRIGVAAEADDAGLGVGMEMNRNGGAQHFF